MRVYSVVSNALRPRELQPSRRLCPWDSVHARILEWVASAFSSSSVKADYVDVDYTHVGLFLGSTFYSIDLSVHLMPYCLGYCNLEIG